MPICLEVALDDGFNSQRAIECLVLSSSTRTPGALRPLRVPHLAFHPAVVIEQFIGGRQIKHLGRGHQDHSPDDRPRDGRCTAECQTR